MTHKVIKTIEDIQMPADQLPYDEMTASEDDRTARLSKPQVDQFKRARAYELYMGHNPVQEIANQLGINAHTIRSWANREQWTQQRKDNDEIVLAQIVDSKKVLLGTLVEELLVGVTKAVKRDAGKNGFKAKDVPTYLNALSSIEKLSRLSLGQATSISEERTKRANFSLPAETLKQLTGVRVADPFEEQLGKGTTDGNETTNSGAGEGTS